MEMARQGNERERVCDRIVNEQKTEIAGANNKRQSGRTAKEKRTEESAAHPTNLDIASILRLEFDYRGTSTRELDLVLRSKPSHN